MDMPGYTPSPWGIRYHRAPHTHVLGAGAAGPGKSLILLADPFSQIIVDHARMLRDPRRAINNEADPLFQAIADNPLRKGYSVGWAVHLRRLTPMLKTTLMRAKRIFPSFDPYVRWEQDSSGTHTAIFSSGYRYMFTHCKDRDGWGGHQSNEYTHIAYDEANQFLEEQVDQINTRLRTDDPVLKPLMRTRYMSNPTMIRAAGEDFAQDDPFWLRKRFVDMWPAGNRTFRKRIRMSSGRSRDETWIYLPAKLSDNPDKEFVEDYEFRLRTAKPHIRKALLEGDWYTQAGSFFADVWDRHTHVHAPFRIPDDWVIFRSMDWGFKTHGAVHWWAIDHDGNMWCFDELSFIGKDIIEVAKEIRSIEEGYGLWAGNRSRITGPADTSLWDDRGERGISKAHTMAMHGVNWVKSDKRSRQRNAELVHGRLKDVRDGVAGIMIFERCRMLSRTLPSITTSRSNPNEPEKGGEDHWYDSCSYAAAYASRDPRSIGRSKASIEDEFWDEGDHLETEDLGQYGYGSPLC